MGSGRKELQFNSREREISTDLNRLQKFSNHDSAELLRYLLNANCGTDDTQAAGLGAVIGPATLPDGEIINGLMVIPQNISLNLTVSDGLVLMLNADSPANPDDSAYKYVADPGISSLGSLVMTANPSGSDRIDIVECARLDNDPSARETDNRDIFDPVTGTFSAISVTKARASRLQYRVRAGSLGGPNPGTAAGWMPLAVVFVPAGAVTNDDMTFWDVRTLISDRAYGPQRITNELPEVSSDSFATITDTDATDRPLTGQVNAILNGRRVCGKIMRGTPGSDAVAAVSVNDAANQETGYSTSNGIFWVYCCTPLGFHRWARYSDAPAVRLPRSPRGVIVASRTPCDNYGRPSAPLTIPKVGTVQPIEAVSIAAGVIDSAKAVRFVQNNRVTTFCTTTAPVLLSVTNTSALTVGDLFDGTITAGTHFPANAKRVHVCLTGTIAPVKNVASYMFFQAYNSSMSATPPGGNAMVSLPSSSPSLIIYTGMTGVYYTDAWLNLRPTYPAVNSSNTYAVKSPIAGTNAYFTQSAMDNDTTGLVVTFTAFMHVIGWEC